MSAIPRTSLDGRRRRRTRAVVSAATAVVAVVAGTAAAAQATGHAPGGAPVSHQPPTVSKFDPAVLRVAQGTTPQARARLMEQVLPDFPAEVNVYHVHSLWHQGIRGDGVSVATIVSFGDPNIQQVIDTYDTNNGLPPAHVTILAPVGDPSCPPGQQSVCANWAAETDLDVEMIHAMAPDAHIYVVATPVAETEGLHGFPPMMHAIDYLVAHKTVQVISMSLSAVENTFKGDAPIRRLAQTFVGTRAAGIPVLAATGDQGASGPKRHGTGLYHHRVVGWPASDPNVTAVGGTVLHLSGGHRTSPDTLIQFSGGGFSSVFGRPYWQDGVRGITHSGMRNLPDITMEGIHGTSQSTPMFAGILALATQENGGKPLGFVNPALYALGPAGTANGIVDVTEGNNDWQGVTGFDAGKGYDVASGWGTISADKFVPALVAEIHTLAGDQ